MHAGESKELRSRFHQLQESIFFYQGWIATESKAMSQSDEHFVTVIKKVTGPLIKEAERQISEGTDRGARVVDTHGAQTAYPSAELRHAFIQDDLTRKMCAGIIKVTRQPLISRGE